MNTYSFHILKGITFKKLILVGIGEDLGFISKSTPTSPNY
jgi:hypothetical protein